jgi:SM-20-related protein
MPQPLPGSPPRPSSLCPYWQFDHLLGEHISSQLLGYAIDHQSSFENSRVGSGGDVKQDPRRRISSVCRLRGPLQAPIRERILSLLPAATDALGMYPFTYGELEMELAAHGDGAFFSRHTDVRRDMLGAGSSRQISAVYYFHEMPRQFEGGMLRLYAASHDDEESYVDITPRHDSVVFFPSCLWHEVLPVRAPGIAFGQQRFALNVWVHKVA